MKWTNDKIALEATKYENRKDFKAKSGSAYVAACRCKILDEVCSHMEAPRRPYTKKWLTKEALKYNYRIDFTEGNRAAYESARSKGILDDICSHMIYKIKWNKVTMQERADMYMTRKEFMVNDGGAYRAAIRADLLDEICVHMGKGLNGDNDAVYIWKTPETWNDKPLYKVGVTSARLGATRILQVASSKGWDIEVIVLAKIIGKATNIEKKLLSLGEDPKLIGFNGATEIRAFDSDELQEALTLINSYAVEQCVA